MQEQVRLPEFLVHFVQNTNFRVVKNTPPLENLNLARNLHFEFWVVKHTPSPPQKNSNLAKTWYFELWVVKNAPAPEVCGD